jgi:sulfur carrier protein
MRVTLKLFATLRDGRFTAAARTLPPGARIVDALQELGIDEADAPLLFVNGRKATASTELHDGDVLAVFPPVGGG